MKDWFRERFHGLYWRQMAVTVGMVFLTLVLLGVSFFSLSYSYARGQKTDELMVRAMAVSKLSVRYLETGRYLSMEELQKDEQFRQLAATAAVISEMDILVCDMDGHVLLSTDATMEGRSVTIPSSVMDKVSTDGIWAGRSRLDQIYASKQFVGGVSVVNPTTGEVLGAVFTVCASDSVDNLWRAFAGLLMMTGFVVLMISFMASSITTMRQIKPIREMAAATRQYADGDFDVRMNDYGREDEIGELAASFNNMAESLQQTERQRREFIANISHELKTPITSILGFTELMTSGVVTDPEQRNQYLERIGEEGRRMSNLIDDILRLSSLESKKAEEVWERVDLRGLCEDIFRSLEPIMKKRGITGEIYGAAYYYAYPDDLRQLLKNLLENAVKYNRENGRVTVRISPDAYQCVISVVDTGIGIPLEHQSRVFERFYRVDKGRSKREGGTGLGLSIVKHITAKYSGQITLVSRPDEGTSIRVTLPVTEEDRI